MPPSLTKGALLLDISTLYFYSDITTIGQFSVFLGSLNIARHYVFRAQPSLLPVIQDQRRLERHVQFRGLSYLPQMRRVLYFLERPDPIHRIG